LQRSVLSRNFSPRRGSAMADDAAGELAYRSGAMEDKIAGRGHL
jgi:hypothetical protein